MKLPWDKQYLKISFHVVFTVLIIYILAGVAGNLTNFKDTLLAVLGKLISVFAPLLVALVIAFLMNPAVDFFQKKWEKYMPTRAYRQFSTRKRGTATVYILVLLVIYCIIQYAVLKIGATDVTAIANKINAYISDFSNFFVLISVKLAEYGIFQNIESLLSSWTTSISELLQAGVMSVTNSIQRQAAGQSIFY